MSLNKYIHPFWYTIADYITAALAWILFFFLRKIILGQPLETDKKFWLGIFFIPLGWIIIFGLVGSYNSIYKKSRLTEFTTTFICTLIGCTGLFFLFLLDDVENNYNYYYSAFGILFGLYLILTWVGRLIILSIAKTQITNKTIRFKAAIVGNYENAIKIYIEAENKLEVEGYYAVGYIGQPGNAKDGFKPL